MVGDREPLDLDLDPRGSPALEPLANATPTAALGLLPQVERLLDESVAMVEWAADRGLTPSAWAIEAPLRIQSELEDLGAGLAVDDRTASPNRAMIQIISGRNGSPGLASAHAHLSNIVHPARPRTVLRLQQERRRRNSILQFFGPLPIVRRLVIASIFLLIVFVAFAASPSVRSLTSGSGSSGNDPAVVSEAGE